ncbi:hypothetical protein KR074_006122 [Drosophila pseudoananassae]|nr:hypothetical protein KR074_006122 [Drosophila pseudoananassae]
MKTESNEKWIVCRVCLNNPSDGEELLQEIFSQNASTRLDQMLHICAGIPVSQDDNFPDKMCSKCVRCLRFAYKFRLTCQRSHQHIMDMLDREASNSGVENESLSLADDLKVWEEDISQLNVKHEEERKNQQTEEQEDQTAEQLVTYVVEDAIEFDAAGEHIEEEYETIQTVAEETESENFAEYEEFELVTAENSPAPPEETCKVRSRKRKIKEIDSNDYNDDVLSVDEHDEQGMVTEETPRPKAATNRQRQTKKRVQQTRTVTESNTVDKKLGRKPRGKLCTFICDVCGNIYPTQARLTEHLKFHSGVKPHECEICGRGFVQNQQLVRHMNTHTGNRPYKCNYCPAAFADRSTKTKHHRIHTKERPYECDVCSRTFTYSDNLKFHKMIHTGEKPHTCDICGKGFVKAYKMRLHRMTHEKRGPWKTMQVDAGPEEDGVKGDMQEFLR